MTRYVGVRETTACTIRLVTDVAGDGDAKSNVIFDQFNVEHFYFRTRHNNIDGRLNTQTDMSVHTRGDETSSIQEV